MLSSRKFISHLELPLLDKLREGQPLVFTNGCFDVLHPGHVSLLSYAASLGDVVVAVNSDCSVAALKPGRPMNKLADRITMLSALECVKYVTWFAQSTPLDLIKAIKPDVLVKGADYEGRFVAGAEEMEDWGGRLVFAPTVEGYSTTNFVEKVQSISQKTE